jgi:hypothetical protein
MAEKLKTLRQKELRATSENSEVKEKNNYLTRLLKTAKDSVIKLEE